jgi:hypothetical protein
MAPMAETMPAYTIDSTGGAIVAVRRAWRDVGQLFERALVAFAFVAAASFAFVAIAHLSDRAFITYQAGSRMGLALYAREGILYPPFFHEGFYGGTRMMPVPILLHAGLSFVTGEFVGSGKLLTYLSYLALLAVAFGAMRSLGCSAARSTVLLVAVTVSGVGIWTSLTISYDPLPVALQLVALALVARGRGRVVIVMAALLCSLALFSKLGAIWGAGTIGLWLWSRNRRALGSFLGVYLAASGLGFLLVQLASGGRFWQNVYAFSSSAVGEDGIDRIPSQLAQMAPIAPLFYVLLLLAVIELVLASRGRSITIYHVAVPFAAATLIVALTRSGADFNHSLDLMILSAVMTARLWMRWTQEHLSRAALVPIAVMLAMIAAYPKLVETSVEVSPGRLRGDIGFLDRLVSPGDRILAEDASIPIARGQVPVVLDAFMLPAIGARDPEALEALVERLEHHGFDRVILFYPLNDAPEGWYTMQFGTRVADAIARNYTLVGGGNRSYVYVPRAP